MKIGNITKNRAAIFISALAIALIFLASARILRTSTNGQRLSKKTAESVQSPLPPKNTQPVLAQPMNQALSRVTKKFFGTFVTPQNSPVTPEKFKGYHTGVDFETFADEQNIDVQVYAICNGKLLIKKSASGYGGVAVESCKIDNQDATVIYGHLRLTSIVLNTDDKIISGSQIALLGTGFSKETDGERKHLHLAIHKGNSINILGYVQNLEDLTNWLDPLTVLKQ